MTIYKGIDSSKPIQGSPLTQNVRDNFEATIQELIVLDANSGGGGALSFLELNDTPAVGTYPANAGKLIKVDPTGSFLVYGDPSGSTVSWGDILGTLSDQTDLQAALDAKAPMSHTHLVSDITDFDPANYLQNINSESIQDLSDVAAMTPAEGEYMGYNFTSSQWEIQDKLLKNTSDEFSGVLDFLNVGGATVGAVGINEDGIMAIAGDVGVEIMGPAVKFTSAEANEGAYLRIGGNGVIVYEQPADVGQSWQDTNSTLNPVGNNVREDLGVSVTPTFELNSGTTEWAVNVTAGNNDLVITIFIMVGGVEFTNIGYVVGSGLTSTLYSSIPIVDDFMTGAETVTLEILATWSGGSSCDVNSVDLKLSEPAVGGGGATKFTDLTDVQDYAGQNGKLVKVDATGTGLVYGDPSGTTVSWGAIQGLLSDQTDLQVELDGKSDNSHSHNVVDLLDVTLTSISANELLQWTGSAWINRTLAEAGISATTHNHDGTYLTDITNEPLGDLSNVTLTSIGVGELLKWTGAIWVNNTLAEAGISAVSHNHDGTYLKNIFSENIEDLSNVAASGLVDGQVLTWVNSAGEWQNIALPTSNLALDDLTDVAAPAPAQDEVLSWSGSAWVNAPPPAADISSKLSHTGGTAVHVGETDYNFGAPVSGNVAIDLVNGQVQYLQTNGNVTVTEITSTGHQTIGFTLFLNWTSSHTITWPANIAWPNATVPSNGGASITMIVTFVTRDSGVNWFATYSDPLMTV